MKSKKKKKKKKKALGCKQGFQYTPTTLCSSLNSLKALIDQNKKKNQNKIINHYSICAVVENWLVKNAVNLSKIIFTSLNFHMHIFNMSVIYLQSVKRG